MRDLLRVLIRPAETMRAVLARERRYTFALVLVASVSAFLANRRPVDNAIEPVLNVLLLVGLFYLFAAIAYFAGKFLGGTGTHRDVRAALAWGSMPVIVALAWRIPLAIRSPRSMLVDLGDSGFRFSDAPAGGCAITLLAIALQLATIAWTTYVATHTVAEAHRFAWQRGLGTIAIAAVFPIVVILAALLTALI